MRLIKAIHYMLLCQRGHMFEWVPVCLAIGIGCYFSLRFEPDLLQHIALAALCAGFALISRWLGEAFAPLAIGICLCLVGFLVASARAHMVGGPVLDWRYYGAVEGRVVAIDRSQSDALRLTLDQVRLERVPAEKTPDRVRISMHGDQTGSITVQPGLRVMTTAHLSPPSGPIEPGGFDFQRHAWFAGLGAVGYSRVPLLGVAPAHDGQAGLMVFRIRMAASQRIQAVLAGDIGGFAAALTTGDRSAIGQTALESLRVSNLAHLLAISGLHMGLLTALVFGALRFVLAVLPGLALNWPIRSIAAGGALVAASGYLALSGGSVATERAFIMVAVALGALIIGRRALSLRSVAIAATLVLLLRPEALMGPGFQMSFAATTALVVVFGWLRGHEMRWVPLRLRPAFGVFISSSVAGLATAPIAAAHFNTIAHYGLVANLLSVPLMGVLIMPAAVLALLLYPFGGEELGLWVMSFGLRWVLGVAQFVSGLEGARGYVPGPTAEVLPMLTLGLLFVLLWQGRLRWFGLLPAVLSFFVWHEVERPDILISDNGALVGYLTDQGRALSKPKGAGFIARNWLENDGDGVEQQTAASRWGRGLAGTTPEVIHLTGKRALKAFRGCHVGQIVVASVNVPDAATWPCDVYDPQILGTMGAVAFWRGGEGWQRTTARDIAGARLWNRWPEMPRP